VLRRKFSDEFKEEAVNLAQRSGVPMSQTAKELGINAEMLRRWVKEFGVCPDGSRGMTPADTRFQIWPEHATPSTHSTLSTPCQLRT
jgi:transposase-like protein